MYLRLPHVEEGPLPQVYTLYIPAEVSMQYNLRFICNLYFLHGITSLGLHTRLQTLIFRRSPHPCSSRAACRPPRCTSSVPPRRPPSMPPGGHPWPPPEVALSTVWWPIDSIRHCQGATNLDELTQHSAMCTPRVLHEKLLLYLFFAWSGLCRPPPVDLTPLLWCWPQLHRLLPHLWVCDMP